MLISLVTFGMYRLGMASRDVIVWFGVLHLLGVCMMLYPVYKKLPTQALAAVGVVLVVTGYLISGTVVEAKFPVPVRFCLQGFTSSDFFPDSAASRLVYARNCSRQNGLCRTKKRACPARIPRESAIARDFFCWCGRQSLFIYLLRQPVRFTACWN